MEEQYHKFDQAFRKKFEEFAPEPPESAWSHIQARIGTPPPSAPIIHIILPVLLGLLFIVAFLLIQLSFKPSSFTGINTPSDVPENSGVRSGTWLASVINSPEIPVNIDNQVSLTSQPAYPATETFRNSVSSIPVRAPFNQPSSPGKSSSKAASNNQPATEPGTIHDDRAKNAIRERFTAPGNMQARKTGQITGSSQEYFTGNLAGRKTAGFDDPEYFTRLKPSVSLGLYFTPEAVFYPSGDLEKGTSLSFSLLPILKFDKIFLQSGISARLTKDAGNYQINYNQYLGQYEDVYLVTFDTTQNGIIPIYHTQTVDVFDTIDHYAITQTTARYTYLELPLLVGYQKTYNRLSWFVKGGPLFSVVAFRHIPDAELSEGPARILNVDRQIPVRADLNWQLMASAGIDFRFSRQFSFSFEPAIRYYLSPEISSGQVTGNRPFAIGLRAGLIYHFKY